MTMTTLPTVGPTKPWPKRWLLLGVLATVTILHRAFALIPHRKKKSPAQLRTEQKKHQKAIRRQLRGLDKTP